MSNSSINELFAHSSLLELPKKHILTSSFQNDKNFYFIEKIIVKALPNLQHYYDIRKKIVELSKGNARVALMATYSVTPDSETNYLNSPVLLYEKYFEKIALLKKKYPEIVIKQGMEFGMQMHTIDLYQKLTLKKDIRE